jgi:hypothetical protein
LDCHDTHLCKCAVQKGFSKGRSGRFPAPNVRFFAKPPHGGNPCATKVTPNDEKLG